MLRMHALKIPQDGDFACSINFVNTSGVSHMLDRDILESLYTNYASWNTTFPTVDLTPYAANSRAAFSTDITLDPNYAS